MVKLELHLPPGLNRISKLPFALQLNIMRVFGQVMEDAVERSKTAYLSGPRPEKLGVITGLLRRSVLKTVVRATDKRYFAVGILGVEGVPYARIHELGGKTRPHIIQAREKPYLVFYWKKKHTWMRIKKVNHPGSKIKKRPYLRPALEDTAPQIVSKIEKAIMQAYKET